MAIFTAPRLTTAPAAATAGTAKPAVAHLKALTGLRILAALLVVMHHFLIINTSGSPGVALSVKQIAQTIVAHGFVGVSFFFILSGFILTYNYIDVEGRLRVPRWDFWVARIARIYPAYLIGFIIATPLYVLWRQQGCDGSQVLCSHNNPIVTGLASLTLTQAFIPYHEPFWNAPSWSLSAEAFFYLLFPVLAVFMARLPRRRLYLSIGALWALTLALAMSYVVVQPDGLSYTHASWLDDSFWLRILYCNPVFRLPEFLMGVALGKLFLLRTRHGGTSGVKLWSPRPGVTAGLALAGVFVVLGIAAIRIQVLECAVLDGFFALLIYSLAFGQGRIAAFFSLPTLILLGEASYAVYILHNPIWHYMSYPLKHVHLGSGLLIDSPVFFLLYLGVTIAISIVCLNVVEQPARRALRRVLTRPARAARTA